MKSWTHPASPHLGIKPGTSHLSTSPLYPLSHPTTLPPFPPSHLVILPPYPPHHPLTCPTFPPKYPPIFLICLRSNSCSETLITFHFPNAMQNYVNSVLTFYTHSPFPRVAPTPQGLNPYTPCIKKIQKNHHYPNHLQILHTHTKSYHPFSILPPNKSRRYTN